MREHVHCVGRCLASSRPDVCHPGARQIDYRLSRSVLSADSRNYRYPEGLAQQPEVMTCWDQTRECKLQWRHAWPRDRTLHELPRAVGGSRRTRPGRRRGRGTLLLGGEVPADAALALRGAGLTSTESKDLENLWCLLQTPSSLRMTVDGTLANLESPVFCRKATPPPIEAQGSTEAPPVLCSPKPISEIHRTSRLPHSPGLW